MSSIAVIAFKITSMLYVCRARTPGYTIVKEVSDGLSSLAIKMQHTTANLEKHLTADVPACIDRAKDIASRLHSLAFPASSSRASVSDDTLPEPNLTHPSLNEAIASLDVLRSALSQTVTKLLKQHSDYHTVLDQSKHEQELERKVMQLFFCAPKVLEQTVEELTYQVDDMVGLQAGQQV